MSRSLKILLADDDNFMRLSIKTLLEHQGHRVIEAIDGSEAVDKFVAEQPDMILLDGIMPNMDGFTACKVIREHKNGTGVPIIIVTGLDSEKARTEHRDILATGYLTKPIDWEQFSQKIAQFT